MATESATKPTFLEAGDGGPGLLLCHPWWGISDGVRQMATDLAAAGFLVVTPDLYAGRTASSPDEAERLRSAFPLAVRQERFDAATRRLLEHPDRQRGSIGAVGLSMGVAWALGLAAAHPSEVGAVVLYYGTGDPDETYEAGSFACLGHFAADDAWESEQDIGFLRDRLARSEIPVEFHTYSGTVHWFAESDITEAFDPQAATLAMERTVAFLRSRLAKP